MSDDRYLGLGCLCIPRRYLCLLFALGFCAYGLVSVTYLTVFRLFLSSRPLTPKHCSGHSCDDILSCDATREATYHVREVAVIAGGTFFGFFGCIGLWQGAPRELRLFTGFLAGLAALLLAMDLYDFAYVAVCNHYPYRVVQQALLWPLYNAPVSEAIKAQITHGMKEYPVEYLRALTRVKIEACYWVVELPAVVILAYIAYCVNLIEAYSTQGVFGLGPNFSLADWRQRNDNHLHMVQTIDLMRERARKTMQDVAWRPVQKVSREFTEDVGVVRKTIPKGATGFVGSQVHRASLYLPDASTQIGKVVHLVGSLPDNPLSMVMSGRGQKPPGPGAASGSGHGYGSAP